MSHDYVIAAKKSKNIVVSSCWLWLIYLANLWSITHWTPCTLLRLLEDICSFYVTTDTSANRTFGDICLAFQCQSESPLYPAHNRIFRFTSSTTLADLLATRMAAELIQSTFLRTSIDASFWSSDPPPCEPTSLYIELIVHDEIAGHLHPCEPTCLYNELIVHDEITGNLHLVNQPVCTMSWLFMMRLLTISILWTYLFVYRFYYTWWDCWQSPPLLTSQQILFQVRYHDHYLS